MTQKIVNGLRSIATEIESLTEVDEDAVVIPVTVTMLRDWASDIRVCAEDLGDD